MTTTTAAPEPAARLWLVTWADTKLRRIAARVVEEDGVQAELEARRDCPDSADARANPLDRLIELERLYDGSEQLAKTPRATVRHAAPPADWLTALERLGALDKETRAL